ncbi:hypothetical protein [Stenomitos frigidus]|uniref:HepT-like domain-containing protein n=1 Tax=Stenomitos frigidus ULC18 TaxID=2107698 RepID=A0A2T1DYZ6_9CYAN|nr:hypothetical protein [Stenomitos frigidus]PSB25594.1 hypothetical protein C7B82_22505 [Stenomitos frigidus ULC18]
MDARQLTVFTADVRSQIQLIQRVAQLVELRAQGLQREDAARLESVAYQVHNFYNAVEDLLKTIAVQFENQVTDTSRWHQLILQRMTQEIPAVRPAFLSQNSFEALNALRGFRHFFRHAYGVPIEYEQLFANLNRVRAVLPILEQDVKQFLQQLQ